MGHFFSTADMKLFLFFPFVICAASPSSAFNAEQDIEYLLFTKANPTVPQKIQKGNASSLLNSNFDATKPVKITIHGWLGGSWAIVHSAMNSAFLNKMDVNMINVDWSKGAGDPLYVSSVANSLPAGKSVGSFMDWLSTQNVPFSNFHLIGHSLGAHVAGIAGRFATAGKVEYITGLDPAGPLWTSISPRIVKTDAKYVEIIHTSSYSYGLVDALGHNDFYPNGGVAMPGCFFEPLCAHMRSIYYMAESIGNQNFKGSFCTSVVTATAGTCTSPTKLHMGGASIKPALGIFHLRTNAYAPYARG